VWTGTPDIRIIAEALGHESLESTKTYTQVSCERTRQIVEFFGPPGGEALRCRGVNLLRSSREGETLGSI
jgi:hypothetical protein